MRSEHVPAELLYQMGRKTPGFRQHDKHPPPLIASAAGYTTDTSTGGGLFATGAGFNLGQYANMMGNASRCP